MEKNCLRNSTPCWSPAFSADEITAFPTEPQSRPVSVTEACFPESSWSFTLVRGHQSRPQCELCPCASDLNRGKRLVRRDSKKGSSWPCVRHPGNAGEGLLCPMLHSLGQCEVQSQSNMAASGGQGGQWSYLHPAPLSSVTIFLSSSSVLYSSWEAWRNPWQAKGFTSKERCATGVSNAGNQRSLIKPVAVRALWSCSQLLKRAGLLSSLSNPISWVFFTLRFIKSEAANPPWAWRGEAGEPQAMCTCGPLYSHVKD